MQRVMNSIRRQDRGFTLVEMAMVIIIIGVAIAAGGPFYSSYMKKKAFEKTKENIEEISGAIGDFRALYGRYPCPSSLTDPRNSNTYGHEPVTTCTDTTQAVGDCTGGVCIQQSIRDVNSDPAITDRPRVRVGWIPFRELNIPEDDAFDSYGNRLLYAVTERLAVSATFAMDQGGIEVLNDQNQTALGDPTPTLNRAGSAHFILLSGGRDGAGAYTKEGVRLPCPPVGSFEQQNSTCAIGPGSANSIFRMALANDSVGVTTHFDDQMSYFTKEEVPLWQKSTVDDRDIHAKNAGDVGVYMGPASNVADRFEVGGDIQIDDNAFTNAVAPAPPQPCIDEEGCLMADELCAPGSLNCFSSKLIAGNKANANEGLECPGDDPDGTGNYMVAIRAGKPVCENEVAVAMCPPGEVMTGFDAGALVCSGPPVVCPPTEEPDCLGNHPSPPLMLPQAVAGAWGQIASGISMIDHFQCMSDGTWQYDHDTGNCDCVADTPPYTTTESCDTGFTGTETVTWAEDCTDGYDGNIVAVSTDTSACICDPSTPPETTTNKCPTGFNSGKKYLRRDWSCTPSPGWSAWYVYNNTCACNPTSKTTTTACSGNLTGSGIVTKTDFTCPGGSGSPGSWQPPVVVSTDCKCEAGRTETWEDDNACPSGQTGTVTYKHSLSCPAATWGPQVEVSRDCKPLPPQVCKWTAQSSGNSGQAVALGAGRKGDPCACGAAPAGCYSGYGPWTNYSVCSCQ